MFGDNSYNKDNLRRALSTGSACIPGSSTIQINEIARQKIFDSINQTSFTQLKLLKEEYTKLKLRLARIPTMMDFVNNGFIDPLLFIDYAGSYYGFKCKVEKEDLLLSAKEMCSLQFLSLEFARGFRVHEILLLQKLMQQEQITCENFSQILKIYNVTLTEKDIAGMCNLLSPDFYTQADKKKYGGITYVSFDKTTQIFTSITNIK